ncbi:MAG: hypothetical protein M1814_001552 [Vezdaea aestivalis]|nr:MAG: hypothetical protein M1814_001552 [Vezdaea aestivalis]
MALASWKTFNFFDVSQVKIPRDGDKGSVFENQNVVSLCSGSENLFLGSSDGVVSILNQSFKVVRSFKAYNAGSITHLRQMPGTALLLTVAEDLSNEPQLKVWALNKKDSRNDTPECQSSLSIQNKRKQFPISALAVLDDLSQVAVGFANGSVTVIRGDLIHDRGAKQRTVFESEEPITGVQFYIGAKVTTLYITTTGRILTLTITGKGQGQPARGLEDSGCDVGCVTLDERSGDLIVARRDAIFYYGPSGRGPCFAFEGSKSKLSLFKDYVALVSPPRIDNQDRTTRVLRGLGGSQADELFNSSTFTLVDPDLKLIAHTQTIISQVKEIFVEWGDLFVLMGDGKVFRYREKTAIQKLEILYHRDLYILAINLANKARLGPRDLNTIYRKYGDYLYQKSDYDGAMQQYLQAIDNTEPSQVIRKFLDTQRIHNLIEYLEELHEHRKATADHTTLLLNCYAKLKDVSKLETFIKSTGDLKFDLDTAINMCRQGGYFAQAAYLATKHGEHDLVVDILIEDSKAYPEALDYIWRLEPILAHQNLMKYDRVLLEHCSVDTTRLFTEYFTGKYRPKMDKIEPLTNEAAPGGALMSIQNLAALIPIPYVNTVKNESQVTQSIQPGATNGSSDAVEEPRPQYVVPKPRTAFSSFVDHPDKFIQFLEVCISDSDPSDQDKVDLYTTLFEMYLSIAQSKKGDEIEAWQNKAKKLVEDPGIPMDPSTILLLSDLSSFKSGTVLIRENQGLYFDIFRSFTSARDTAGAIKALHKYGSQEPQLYPAALAYFTSSVRILEEAGDELAAVLKKIDDDGLMAPLQVIQTLSSNSVATMGMVKSYLGATIEKERKEIAYNRRLIDSYRTETEQKRTEIATLGSTPTVFQASRCSSCGGALSLPTVHFLCKHSFHQHCLNATSPGADDAAAEGNDECPVCAPQNATIRAIKRSQDDAAERQDLFKDQMKKGGGMMTVSEYFGRGVMGVGGGVE